MMDDTISRQKALDLVRDVCDAIMSCCDSHYDAETGDEVYADLLEVDAILKCNKEIRIALGNMPSAQPEIKPIDYRDCANAMLMMWMWNVLTDGEYYRIMDKLNRYETERRNDD